jgi:hypothetical protein
MNEGKSINKLKGPEQFKFYKWFEDQTFEYGLSDAAIAVRASEALGFSVTIGNVFGAWAATGKTRPRAPVTDNQKIAILKRAVESLYKELQVQLPPEWTDL